MVLGVLAKAIKSASSIATRVNFLNAGSMWDLVRSMSSLKGPSPDLIDIVPQYLGSSALSSKLQAKLPSAELFDPILPQHLELSTSSSTPQDRLPSVELSDSVLPQYLRSSIVMPHTAKVSSQNKDFFKRSFHSTPARSSLHNFTDAHDHVKAIVDRLFDGNMSSNKKIISDILNMIISVMKISSPTTLSQNFTVVFNKIKDSDLIGATTSLSDFIIENGGRKWLKKCVHDLSKENEEKIFNNKTGKFLLEMLETGRSIHNIFYQVSQHNFDSGKKIDFLNEHLALSNKKINQLFDRGHDFITLLSGNLNCREAIDCHNSLNRTLHEINSKHLEKPNEGIIEGVRVHLEKKLEIFTFSMIKKELHTLDKFKDASEKDLNNHILQMQEENKLDDFIKDMVTKNQKKLNVKKASEFNCPSKFYREFPKEFDNLLTELSEYKQELASLNNHSKTSENNYNWRDGLNQASAQSNKTGQTR